MIAGVDWVTANAIKPAVANMSLGVNGAAPGVGMLDDSIDASIASGDHVRGRGRQQQRDACAAPARAEIPTAITVAATTIADSRARRSRTSARASTSSRPGLNIVSDWNSSNSATNTISGTSMATPHVAGAVARYLATNPCATPATVASAIVGNATPNKVTTPGTGTPNLLLTTSFLGANSGPAAPCAPPDLTVTAGYNLANLTWTIPADGGSPISGYNVYRSTTPGGEGAVPFATVSGVSNNSFTDNTATGGTTYYYQVARGERGRRGPARPNGRWFPSRRPSRRASGHGDGRKRQRQAHVDDPR